MLPKGTRTIANLTTEWYNSLRGRHGEPVIWEHKKKTPIPPGILLKHIE
jgi:hypothetical protein